ncbi:hypothetical protein K505DRAFT_151535 [Melanomma pulvis-pyrius CBS 109.77]|uniref:Uncharacterized protein n=1 Tax=Melanomma pulvis-pyrius CBS 109.77 TaxID=1314802 RepID=A0A6A6WQI3_9PLEO|nr:hypothetical protein K505DRAFT_151535 [Melanomma pulvis-pyrius CBS 109.77]
MECWPDWLNRGTENHPSAAGGMAVSLTSSYLKPLRQSQWPITPWSPPQFHTAAPAVATSFFGLNWPAVNGCKPGPHARALYRGGRRCTVRMEECSRKGLTCRTSPKSPAKAASMPCTVATPYGSDPESVVLASQYFAFASSCSKESPWPDIPRRLAACLVYCFIPSSPFQPRAAVQWLQNKLQYFLASRPLPMAISIYAAHSRPRRLCLTTKTFSKCTSNIDCPVQ